MARNLFDLEIKQGETLSLVATWRDSANALVNLTGYTARAQGRATYDASSTLFSLTSSSGITLGGAAGTITITLSATATAALSAPQQGVWDLELVSGSGVVTRLLEGDLRILPEATR